MDLRTYRKLQGWTQDELGKLVGVSGVTIHRWERQTARPSLDAVERIQQISAGAVTVSDFMRDAALGAANPGGPVARTGAAG